MNLDLKIEQIINLLKSQKFEKMDEVKFLVKLLLPKLEWSDKEVHHSHDNQSIDFSLIHNGKPLVFVICNKYSVHGKKYGQITSYADLKNIPIICFTDGIKWLFYIKFDQISPSYQIFHKLDLNENPNISDLADIFSLYLSKSQVISGETTRIAKEKLSRKHERVKVRKIAQEAWKSLLERPDEILRDLVIETMDQKWGIKPEIKIVEDFLKEQINTSEEPDVDTLEQVGISKKPDEDSPLNKINITPNELHKLAFTRLTMVKINDQIFESKSWNELYQRILLMVLDSGHSLEELKRVTGANIVHGVERTKGFKFVPSHDFSFQGESAPKIAGYLSDCSKILGNEIQIEFVWKENKKAHRSGFSGRLNLS